MRRFGRALVRRCPRCGEHPIFRGWFTLVDECPRCRMRYEREEGYWVGAVAVNTVVTELVFAVLFVGGMLVTWPHVPWTGLLIVCLVANGLFPIFFYPLSKTVWLAVDLMIHPLELMEEIEAELRRT